MKNSRILTDRVVIENMAYHHEFVDVTWETSSIRQYLNGDFFNNFSQADRARIRETYVINNDNPWTFDGMGNTPGGANTTDRIFLLSIDEVLRYFGDSGILNSRKNHTYK